MARTEKDFLNTLETYVKITQDRLRDGRIIDAHEELQIIEKMISQRKEEVNGTAAWENISKQAETGGKQKWQYVEAAAQKLYG